MSRDEMERILDDRMREIAAWHRRRVVWFWIHLLAVLALTVLMWWVFIR